jgi:hypothetical protein
MLVGLSGLALVDMLLFAGKGDLIGGWSLDAEGIRIGMTRVMFPFSRASC